MENTTFLGYFNTAEKTSVFFSCLDVITPLQEEEKKELQKKEKKKTKTRTTKKNRTVFTKDLTSQQ